MPKTPKKADSAKYPELQVVKMTGDKAMTFEQAKKYLGWREDNAEEKFTEFDLELPNGRRVIFDNNTKNRPWIPLQLKILRQHHLNRRWRMNPDGIGIGRETGSIMTGQHRLRSFCEAELERQGDPAKWGDEPLTMECIVVLGMDESDETFAILNETAPATASDSFYRQQLFPKQTKSNRATLCKMLEAAIKGCLWQRTGANRSGENPIPTIPDTVDFYDRHPKLNDCCVHIFESYSSGQGHNKRMGSGSAVALMYLMASAATPDRVKYGKKPCDKSLDWSLEGKAQDFWTLVCKGADEFEAVRDVLDSLCSEDEPLAGLYERKVVLTKAWNLYREGGEITRESVKPKSVKDKETGITTLDEFPDISKIDLNEGKGAVQSEQGDPPVAPEDVEAAKAEIDAAKEQDNPDTVEPQTKDDKERSLIMNLRVKHRNKVLLLKTKKELLAWEEDAVILSRLIPSLEVKTYPNGMKYVGWPLKKQVELLGKLKAAKKKAVFVEMDKDGETPICTDPDTGNPI